MYLISVNHVINSFSFELYNCTIMWSLLLFKVTGEILNIYTYNVSSSWLTGNFATYDPQLLIIHVPT